MGHRITNERLLQEMQELHKILSINHLNLKSIMAEQKEAAARLRQLGQQLSKATDEIKGKLDAVQAALDAADDVDPDLQAAIDDLAPAIQKLDDIVPDATTGGEEGTGTGEDTTT